MPKRPGPAMVVASALLVALAATACALPPLAGAEAGTDARFVPGELLVRFDRQADAADRSSALSEVDGETRERLFVPGLRLVEIEAASVPSAAAELERQPGVRYAEPNFIEELSAVPNDTSFGVQWALHNTGQDVNGSGSGGAGTPDADIDAVQAWDRSVGSRNVIVGIADTGVNYTHPDLAPNIYSNPGETANGVDDGDPNGFADDLRGWDFFNNDNNPAPSGVDGSGHGTLVAGAAGARGGNGLGVTGVAQRVSLMPLRVGDTSLSVSALIQAFGYASQLGADVLNVSAGSSNFSQARLDAIRAAPNTLFVFSAGNDGTNNDASPRYPCGHNEPNVVCVAATGQTDALAPFSNYGQTAVDLAAPGVLIGSTALGATYRFASGTSFAAPIVAGAAAVYRARNPGATAAQARNALRASVDKLASLSNRVETDGRLNLARALGIRNPDPEPDPPPETTITGAPKAKVKTRKKKKKATFAFSSSEPGSTFLCQLDGSGFAPCSSPFSIKVKRGRHGFEVQAVDAGDNVDPTPAAHAWKLKRKKRKK